jgi:hypothetical protein
MTISYNLFNIKIMKKTSSPFPFILLFLTATNFLFSQTNIVVENAAINNTPTFYGATNTVTSTSVPSKPVSVLTGDKKVEFVAGNQVILQPGFQATGQTGGSFKAYIDPAFTVNTNPFLLQPNDFRIGMYGYTYIHRNNFYTTLPPGFIEQPYSIAIPDGVTGTYWFNGTLGKSSQLNVLKEDGINTVFNYDGLEGYLGDNSVYIPSIELVKNNGLQLMAAGSHWWKPDANVNSFAGTNVYDGRGTIPPSAKGIAVARPDYDDLLDNVFSNNNYKSTIWGYHMVEEGSHAQPANPKDSHTWCWHSCDPAETRYIDWPVTNTAAAIGHFRSKLNAHGVYNQKLIALDSHHGAAINDYAYFSNYSDGSYKGDHCPVDTTSCVAVPAGTLQGYAQAQDYINPSLMGNNMPDAFFEGSYYYKGTLSGDSWANNPYSNIYNNGNHYLGVFKSIDYAYAKGVKDVHKVLGADKDVVVHFNESIKNANAIWFQVYCSIIHGAKGVWFWGTASDGYDLSDPVDKNREIIMKNKNNSNSPYRFNWENFPLVYTDYVRYLSKELAYLSRKNIISTDPKTVLYTKTDNADPNCIVPASSTYVPNALKSVYGIDWRIEKKGIYGRVADDGEAYGLRYTIRTNGTEVIMIITNPLGVAVKDVVLNFDQLTNPIIKSAGGVDVLFGDPFNEGLSVDDMNYKMHRYNFIDLNTLTLQTNDARYVPFWTNKQLQISFGPLDVKILRFKTTTTIVDSNNGWEKVWTNGGSNAIGTWLLRTNDHIVKGDYNGDGDEELFCTQEASHYATLLDFYSGNWNATWSNNGNNIIGENWLVRNTDILVSGDFDGDSKDELLALQEGNGSNGYANLFSYTGTTFVRTWHNGYNNFIGNWQIRNTDRILVGDFDGDKKDELLCIQPNTSKAQLLKYINGNWQSTWTNNASGLIDNWSMTSYASQYIVGDFDNDNMDEIICFTPSSSSIAEILHFVPAQSNFTHSNMQLNGIPNWQSDLYLNLFGNYVPMATVMAGNIDYDGKEELMYVNMNGKSVTGEYVDANTCVVNWGNTSNSYPYIDDWNANISALNNYQLVKAEKYMPEYLLAFNGDNNNCKPYLVSMYRSQDMTNKKTISTEIVDPKDKNSEAASAISENITVYPNPTSGTFTLTIRKQNNEGNETTMRKSSGEDQTYTVVVYNSLGEEVYIKQNIPFSTTELNINLESQRKGIYLVRVIEQNGLIKAVKLVVD